MKGIGNDKQGDKWEKGMIAEGRGDISLKEGKPGTGNTAAGAGDSCEVIEWTSPSKENANAEGWGQYEVKNMLIHSRLQ